MKIRLLYFARLREKFAADGETLEITPAENGALTVADIIKTLRARGGEWHTELAEGKAVAYAVNQTFAAPATPVPENAEVAIFPPVTGG